LRREVEIRTPDLGMLPGALKAPADTAPPCIDRAPLPDLGAVEIADLLLLDLVLRRAAAIVIAPEPTRLHAVRYEQGEGDITRAALDPALADAVAARLALLGGLDITGPGPQIGRLRVAVGREHRSTDLLVALRPTPEGLMAELRRIVDPTEPSVQMPRPSAMPEVTSGPDTVGKYRLSREMGRGGMGIVYRAEHVLLQKPVALKVLHPGVAEDPAMAAQFVLEARAPCRVRHRGIVDVTDFGIMPDGRAFIVMELVEDPTLSELLRHGPLMPRRAVAIALSIAEALAAVASHGVVHRDLKPANIFVGTDDSCKLVDFGIAYIARSAGASTTNGRMPLVSGTPAYMSPEQSLGDPTDARADVYSLGCVLFEMLSGKAPFTGSSPMAVIEHHCSTPVPEVESPLAPVPDNVRRIVARALAKRAAERFQTADEMAAELRRAGELMDRSGWRRWLPR
jgi:hypothetical protein